MTQCLTKQSLLHIPSDLNAIVIKISKRKKKNMLYIKRSETIVKY